MILFFFGKQKLDSKMLNLTILIENYQSTTALSRMAMFILFYFIFIFIFFMRNTLIWENNRASSYKVIKSFGVASQVFLSHDLPSLVLPECYCLLEDLQQIHQIFVLFGEWTVIFTFYLPIFSNTLSNRFSISFKYYFFIHYLFFF